MMRSLYSGVSGLRNHQTKMDVIGNNIANVNTVAFKSSSVTFNDIMYQTTQAASGATETTGGTNAKQIGLGVATGATKISITSAGASESTGNAFDIKLVDSNSTNFFIVNNGSSNQFTRAGSFYIDGNGNLAMASTGYLVQGWQAVTNEDGSIGIRKDTVSSLRIMSPANRTSNPEATENAYAAGIVDKNDTNIIVSDIDNVQANEGYAMSVSFYDDLGYSYTAKFALYSDDKNANNGLYRVKLVGIYDSDNTELLSKYGVAASSVFGFTNNAGTATTTSDYYDLKFDTATGAFSYVGSAGTNSVTMNLDVLGTAIYGSVDASPFSNVDVNFSSLLNQDNGGTSTAALDRGSVTNASVGAGKKLGTLTGVSVDTAGKIYGSYDNGNTVLLGQIAVAQFSNASGLESLGNNCYGETLNSGEFDGIGVEVSADGGQMLTGQLEMSNVDLAQEFTSMITTQRGFQANSRIITVSDTMLEELTNLKR